MRVTCTCCYRVEAWDLNRRDVITEGGLRVPHPNATIAAYRALQKVREQGTSRVVGVCARCQQPMSTEHAEAQAIDWILTMADGSRHKVQTSAWAIEGDLSFDELNEPITQWERTLLRNSAGLGARVFEGSLLGVMLFPVLCWLFAVGMVTLYLNHFFTLE